MGNAIALMTKPIVTKIDTSCHADDELVEYESCEKRRANNGGSSENT